MIWLKSLQKELMLWFLQYLAIWFWKPLVIWLKSLQSEWYNIEWFGSVIGKFYWGSDLNDLIEITSKVFLEDLAIWFWNH